MLNLFALANPFVCKSKKLKQSSFHTKGLCFVVLPIVLQTLACTSSGNQDNKSFLADLDDKKAINTTHPSSARYLPLEIKVGQKSHYLIKGPNESSLSYEWSVKAHGDIPFSFWIEEIIVSEKDRTEWKSLIVMDEARSAVSSLNAEKFAPVITDYNRVSRVVTKPSNVAVFTEQKLTDEAILPALGLRLSWFANANWSKAVKTSVRAGNFKCFNGQVQPSSGQEALTLNGCFDSAVPGNGLVQGKDSKGRSWELIQISQ